MSVAGGAEHLKDTIPHLQHTDVKSAAAQVIDGDFLALAELVQTISQRGGGGLADDALDREPGEFTRLFRGVALRIIEVGRHSDHGAIDGLLQRTFRDGFEPFQNFRRDLDG